MSKILVGLLEDVQNVAISVACADRRAMCYKHIQTRRACAHGCHLMQLVAGQGFYRITCAVTTSCCHVWYDFGLTNQIWIMGSKFESVRKVCEVMRRVMGGSQQKCAEL